MRKPQPSAAPAARRRGVRHALAQHLATAASCAIPTLARRQRHRDRGAGQPRSASNATAFVMPLGGAQCGRDPGGAAAQRAVLCAGRVARDGASCATRRTSRFALDSAFDDADADRRRCCTSPRSQRDLDSAQTGRPRTTMARKRRGSRSTAGSSSTSRPGMTSTQAVARVRRLHRRARPGMPARSTRSRPGVLPIALGEATKTVAFAMDGAQELPLHACAGARRATPTTREGAVIADSAGAAGRGGDRGGAAALHRRDPAAAAGLFGDQGRRRARLRPGPRRRGGRAGAAAGRDRRARPARACPIRDHADFEAVVGKGTYIRALARDLGAALGTLRPCRRAAPARGRAVRRGAGDFAG